MKGDTIQDVGSCPFLSFSLTAETLAMLPTAQLAEVLKLDLGLIVPIPDMPLGVMGICNWREQVLWLVDLAYLLGYGALSAQDWHHPNHTLMVIRSQGKVLGLAVERVGQMVGCNPDQITAPLINQMRLTSPALASCLKGQHLNADGKALLVLDGNAIFEFLGYF